MPTEVCLNFANQNSVTAQTCTLFVMRAKKYLSYVSVTLQPTIVLAIAICYVASSSLHIDNGKLRLPICELRMRRINMGPNVSTTTVAR